MRPCHTSRRNVVDRQVGAHADLSVITGGWHALVHPAGAAPPTCRSFRSTVMHIHSTVET